MWFWEAAPIITYTTGVILGSNFRYQNQEINYRVREMIRKLFEIMQQWKENKIQNFYTQFNGAWIENHLHVAHVIKLKSQYAVKRHWLPQLLQKYTQGGVSACWFQICHQICSLTTPAIYMYFQPRIELIDNTQDDCEAFKHKTGSFEYLWHFYDSRHHINILHKNLSDIFQRQSERVVVTWEYWWHALNLPCQVCNNTSLFSSLPAFDHPAWP